MENEKTIDTKEKVIRKFNRCETMALAIRNILIGIMVIYLICTFASIVEELIKLNGANAIDIIVQTFKQSIEELSSSVNDKVYFGILNILKYLIIILFSDRIAKIFKNSIEMQTPFTKENIKNMKSISWLAFLYVICSVSIGYEIAVYLIITAISYVFEYGCDLQKESDETL